MEAVTFKKLVKGHAYSVTGAKQVPRALPRRPYLPPHLPLPPWPVAWAVGAAGSPMVTLSPGALPGGVCLALIHCSLRT